MSAKEEQDYEEEAKLPLLWQLWARQHIVAAYLVRHGFEAAKKVAPHYTARMPILLSYGLAAENLIKGLLVAQGVLPVKRAKGKAGKAGALELSHELKSHKLKNLFEKAGLNLSDDDKHVLRNLTYAVETARYPIGTKPVNPAEDPTPQWLVLTNLDHVVELLGRVEDALRAKLGKWALEKVDLATLGIDG